MERAATGLCLIRELLGAAAAAPLIDVSGMDTTTMRARVEQARVARLATVRPDGRPHVVPCCFVLSNEVIFGEKGRAGDVLRSWLIGRAR